MGYTAGMDNTSPAAEGHVRKRRKSIAPRGGPMLRIRTTLAQMAVFEAAADEHSLKPTPWARSVLNREAKRVLGAKAASIEEAARKADKGPVSKVAKGKHRETAPAV